VIISAPLASSACRFSSNERYLPDPMIRRERSSSVLGEARAGHDVPVDGDRDASADQVESFQQPANRERLVHLAGLTVQLELHAPTVRAAERPVNAPRAAYNPSP
jgi:hypothetical protein